MADELIDVELTWTDHLAEIQEYNEEQEIIAENSYSEYEKELALVQQDYSDEDKRSSIMDEHEESLIRQEILDNGKILWP
ncbi:MAG TPA: hypothetical protein VII94_02260 [Candidatus Saccharimonadales bacterium]